MKRVIKASNSEKKGYEYRGFYIHETTFGYDVWLKGRKVLDDEYATKDEAEAAVDEVVRDENVESATSITAHFAAPPFETKYSVHWISPEGKDCTLAGSDSIEDVQSQAKNQARQIYNSAFETDERKIHFLENIYIVEDETERDAMLTDTEDYINRLISKIESRSEK